MPFDQSATDEIDEQDISPASVSADDVTINDSATDPSSDGEITRNGAELKVHSGGAVQNLSNIGGSAAINWTKDGELSFSSASSKSYTLSQNYDYVKVVSGFTDVNEWINMQVNGDTGSNYQYRDASASVTTGDSRFFNSHQLAFGPTELHLAGRWNTGLGLFSTAPQSNGGGLVRGRNDNVTSPLTSFKMIVRSGANISHTWEVYGAEIA